MRYLFLLIAASMFNACVMAHNYPVIGCTTDLECGCIDDCLEPAEPQWELML